MMGEMNPDLMGAPRLELAFDQAVAPDFSVASPGFLHTVPCVDRPGACADRRSRPILSPVDDGFVLSYLGSRTQYSRWMFLSSKMRLRMGRIKGFWQIKLLRWFPCLSGARRSR